jgi:hypothetical protein
MPNGTVNNRFLAMGGPAFGIDFLEPLAHTRCRLVVSERHERGIGVLSRFHFVAILSLTGIGLFAKIPIKRNTILGIIWGRYIVLPMDDRKWGTDSASRMHGCRDRVMLLHEQFQPVIGKCGFDANNQVSVLSSILFYSHFSLSISVLFHSIVLPRFT